MKNAIIYARVSTDDQADKGYSLPTQIDACRHYAERLGYAVVREFKDDHSGATPLAERPESKEMMALLRRGEAQALIVYNVDRLSRDIVDLLATVRGWIRSGIEVHSCDIGRIQSELDIVLVIKAWQGGDERQKIIERTMRGANAKAQSGKVVGKGKPPYGYSFLVEAVPTKNASLSNRVTNFAINEEEARIVRLIYQWYVHGDETGAKLKIRGIARRLCELRVIPPGHTPNRRGRWMGKYARRDKMWNEGMVRIILTSETYAGIWRYGKNIGEGGRNGHRSIGDQIAVSVPAIIDRQTWEAAQLQRAYNAQFSPRNTDIENPYLLRGMVKCNCGLSMVGKKQLPRRYYRCVSEKTRFHGIDKFCRQKLVRKEILEQAVWNYILGLFNNEEEFVQRIRLVAEQERSELQPRRDELGNLEEQITETQIEAAKLAEAIKRVPSGGIVAQTLEREISQLEDLYNGQLKRRAELQAKLQEQNLSDDNIGFLLEFRRDVYVGMANPTFEDKRRVLEHLHTKVTVTGQTATVECIIGGTAVELNTRPSFTGDCKKG